MKKIVKIVFAAALSFLSLSTITSCGKKDSGDVTGSCKLAKTPTASKTFDGNGVEECTVTRYTDGDTSAIKTTYSKKTYTIRYLSIDTPESTAGYDKWGKAASLYNKSVLSKATSVVVEAEGSSPEKDTNGTRYLAYIWYKTAEDKDYRNLNLEMVEKGYSNNNCDTEGKYYKYFEKAEQAAKKQKLHIHGNEADIYYSEDIQALSLKQLNESPYYDTETDVPTCVSFTAYVVDYTDSSSFRTAIVEQFDAASGKYYQYKVVVGYSGTIFYSVCQPGSLVNFVGWTTGEGSIHGCKSNLITPGPLDSTMQKRSYSKELTQVQISSATLSNGVATFTGVTGSTNVTIKLTDSTLTQAKLNEYVRTVSKIKAFATATDNEYTINTLSDITK